MDKLARDVLDAVLKKSATSPEQVVSLTTRKLRNRSPQTSKDEWSRMREDLPKLRFDTYEDFYRRNAESVKIKELFGEDIKLIVPEDMSTIFRSDELLGGWDRFHNAYPNSYGIMEISQPGFSADRRQALIDVGHQVHWMSGRGRYHLLEFNGKRWREIGRRVSWRS